MFGAGKTIALQKKFPPRLDHNTFFFFGSLRFEGSLEDKYDTY